MCIMYIKKIYLCMCVGKHRERLTCEWKIKIYQCGTVFIVSATHGFQIRHKIVTPSPSFKGATALNRTLSCEHVTLVCICVCTYVCQCMCVSMCTCKCVSVCVHVCVCMYAYENMCKYMWEQREFV